MSVKSCPFPFKSCKDYSIYKVNTNSLRKMFSFNQIQISFDNSSLCFPGPISVIMSNSYELDWLPTWIGEFGYVLGVVPEEMILLHPQPVFPGGNWWLSTMLAARWQKEMPYFNWDVKYKLNTLTQPPRLSFAFRSWITLLWVSFSSLIFSIMKIMTLFLLTIS